MDKNYYLYRDANDWFDYKPHFMSCSQLETVEHAFKMIHNEYPRCLITQGSGEYSKMIKFHN